MSASVLKRARQDVTVMPARPPAAVNKLLYRLLVPCCLLLCAVPDPAMAFLMRPQQHGPLTGGESQLKQRPRRAVRGPLTGPHRRRRVFLSESSRQQPGETAATATSPPEPLPPFSVTLEGDDYSYSDAIRRTLAWVGAAFCFGSVLWFTQGAATGEEFFAGYLVEQSLSVDNLFVFLLLFDYFKVPLAYQDRVLNWGIYGAVVFRAIMIGLGAALLKKFHVILLFFAGILVWSAAKVFVASDEDDEGANDPSNNSIVKLAKSLFPSVDYFDEDRFFVVVDGIRKATPLFICMIAVEISDIVFAVDSIPAVFGVTNDAMVVFSSNIFAIMGLRSLYTILSKAAADLVYLEPSVAVVLGFIGIKMILEFFGYEIPTNIALSVVGVLLGVGVGASIMEKNRNKEEEEQATAVDGQDGLR